VVTTEEDFVVLNFVVKADEEVIGPRGELGDVSYGDTPFQAIRLHDHFSKKSEAKHWIDGDRERGTDRGQ
jgi:hypothetical protein